ncbi:MAG: hypothetical protein K9M80_08655 [Candidatus Marinimicrobia bacterium]|nr:hypothetical protein [Candidatus Neomarinimicrobiota bacterium]
MKFYERLSILVTAIVYIAVGILIITKPKLLYYGVAAAFFIQGLNSLIRFIFKSGD